MAAVLYTWEKEHGPWEFYESDEERKLREEKERREQEEERLRKLEEKERKISVDVGDFLKERFKEPYGTFFDIMHGIR